MRPSASDLFEVHHEVGARPRGPHRRDLRPGNQSFTGDERPVQHDVVLAMHPTTDALPGGRREISPGRLLSPEDEDHRKHGRDGQTLQHRGGVIAGGRGIRGDGVWPEQAGKRAAPRRRHRELAHHPRPFCGAKLYIPQLAW